MVARRTDARRRRVLSEEFVPTDEEAVACSKKPMQAYSYGANRRNQPKTTDLIPKRAVAFGLFFAFIISVVAAINVAAMNSTAIVEVLGETASETFALSGAGSFANWICSVSLFLCSGLCLQLFLLRKHKRDDYGGMYRVWIVMAIMFLLASIDCAVDLRTIAAKLFEQLTHRSLLRPAWLMMTIESIILAVVVIRMLFEVRASRLSLATVMLVWMGFVGCIILSHAKIPSNVAWLDQDVAYGNCMLAGCVGSFVALTVYARFVFLQAHGLIQLRSKAVVEEHAESSDSDAAPAKESVSSKESRTEAAPPKEVPQPTIKLAKRTTNAPAAAAKPQVAKAAPSRPAAEPKHTVTTKTARKNQAAAPLTLQKTGASVESEASEKKPAQPAGPVRKKPKVVSGTSEPDGLQEELENIDTVSMSKAERRRLRKLAKRAAREKKAA